MDKINKRLIHLIECIEIFESDDDSDKQYLPSGFDIVYAKKMLTELQSKLDTSHQSRIICPHCGTPDHDFERLYDKPLSAQLECHSCGNKYELVQHVYRYFSTSKKL